MRLLFIGDIVGQPGREATIKILPKLKKDLRINFTIANGENVTHGKGLNTTHAHELHQAGIDFFTSGNHIWNHPPVFELMNAKNPFIIRPANYPDSNPGMGYSIVKTAQLEKILIINLMGRVFMKQDLDCPFRTLDKILKKTVGERPDVILVDFHAEATSEKMCFGLYATNRVGAVIGTHTHIQTADETILKNHTAYITDVGFVGLSQSAIGVNAQPIIEQFLSQMPTKHEITFGDPATFNAVFLEFRNGKATKIERITKEIKF
ncbi:MAG: hypothetical protein UT55_C0009G0009 [Candidatus Peregrinibacteria bacterium GW2011_GWE2_39_6]|nr:MAG: hypothetical protein UT36_C0014G0009 [Candidatus Peregrinibacteria bacterium GW2011_GWF2_39_17]KKR26377.1 MAG: hypothetical protein UT55_C0009G0009 [Candidatus Peregrinibacteria bacterium GW2011_GWE2_39_6]HCW32525.1 metallophosphoesterase [Candidatus Peregrinibacteria bacterium]